MSGLLVSPTQDDVLTVLRALLLDILPAGVEVIQAQDNKVSEPAGDDFVLMTPRSRHRLSTNVDGYMDCAFAASIASNVMTVTAVAIGKIVPPAQIFSPSFPLDQKFYILNQISGSPPGGPGTYAVTPGTPDVAPSTQVGVFIIGQSPIEGTKFASGVDAMLQPTDFLVQLDVHGPNSGDNSQIISTMLWDEQAFDFFEAADKNCEPLYCDDPRQMPFANDQQQVENRWVIEAHIQVNAVVTAPQQFADQVTIGLINVDVVYPP